MAAMADSSHRAIQPPDRPAADLLKDMVANVQEIIRSEVRLAKAEIKEETTEAGKAFGLMGAGAIFGLYALGFILLAIVYALALVMTPPFAAFLVALLVGGVALGFWMAGRKRL